MSHRIASILLCAALGAACTSNSDPTAAAGAAGAVKPAPTEIDKAITRVDSKKVKGIVMPLDNKAPTNIKGIIMPLDNKAPTEIRGLVMPPVLVEPPV